MRIPSIVAQSVAVCAITICVCFENSNAHASQDDDAPEPIAQLLQAQVDRWNAGDLDGFMETYWKSSELTFSSGGRTTRGWQATLDRYRDRYSTREAMGPLAFDEIEVTRLGDNAALVLGRWHLERTEESMQGNFSLVLRRFATGWKIVHDHSSLEEPDE